MKENVDIKINGGSWRTVKSSLP